MSYHLGTSSRQQAIGIVLCVPNLSNNFKMMRSEWL
jgi:hypothetical protein